MFAKLHSAQLTLESLYSGQITLPTALIKSNNIIYQITEIRLEGILLNIV